MFWLNTKRICRTGFVSFWRNSFVSLASILVVTVTLFVVGMVIFLSVILNSSLVDLKNKVDVSVYFSIAAPEADILSVKKTIESLPEVSGVQYVSKEEAIAAFRERHKDDYLTLQALEELSYNPLGARLNVLAQDPSQYESIVRFLEHRPEIATAENPNGIIEKLNYRQNKEVIDRLARLIAGAERLGYAFAGVLILISLLITLNTIRLVIYMSREEIAVMRLVGASNFYIRGPFVVAGMLYGFAAAIIAMVLFYPVTVWLGATTTNFFGGINLFEYYLSNFFKLFFVLAALGILLGAIASFLAARKYLRV